MDSPARPELRLTDFLDLATLQEIQDSFAAVANVKASITDAQGNALTKPQPAEEFTRRQRSIEDAHAKDSGAADSSREYVAPITVNDLPLGSIRMSPVDADTGNGAGSRPAAIQFLSLLANAIARMCYQEYQLRRRVEELTAVNDVAVMLAESRDLRAVLDRAVKVVVQAMGVKAASIRLIDENRDELVIRAVFNLSDAYLNKGPVQFSRAAVDRIALSEKGYEYVRDMGTDPRILYPGEAQREGIVSAISVGMRYQGKPIGVLRVYTGVEQRFSGLQIELVKAIAAQAAAAIENARLIAESIESAALERQVQLASDVQQRMLPQSPPVIRALDLASVYAPCHLLGGDFFDFIPLPYDNVGVVIADVSGKGVPASLIMASVRAALRAQVDNVYYVDEVMRRLNVMLCRDTKPTEFVTLFYGVLDVPNMRLTYCNAGHSSPMLLRDGEVSELTSSNLVLGVDRDEAYTQSILDLKRGDALLLYTDGVSEAMNFEQQIFGRQRVIDAFRQGGASAEIIAQNVLWTARKFVGLSPRSDDMTMLVARLT